MSTGSFEERLASFAEQASLRDLSEAAAFTKVVPGTVLAWITGGPLPKGEPFIRMMYYLKLKGLEPKELTALPKPAFDLGEYISSGTLEMETAKPDLGYANTKDLYRLLHGADLTSARAEMLDGVLERYKEDAQEAIDNLGILPFTEVETAVITPVPAPAPEKTIEPQQVRPSFSAEHASGAILTATALVESFILSDDTQLATVAELVGRKRISDLTSYLEMLATN